MRYVTPEAELDPEIDGPYTKATYSLSQEPLHLQQHNVTTTPRKQEQ
jgi:hypothetical protein